MIKLKTLAKSMVPMDFKTAADALEVSISYRYYMIQPIIILTF